MISILYTVCGWTYVFVKKKKTSSTTLNLYPKCKFIVRRHKSYPNNLNVISSSRSGVVTVDCRIIRSTLLPLNRSPRHFEFTLSTYILYTDYLSILHDSFTYLSHPLLLFSSYEECKNPNSLRYLELRCLVKTFLAVLPVFCS